jgi:dinuclear metal center YbgI/SA1388 family protein
MAERKTIVAFLNEYLNIDTIEDVSCNGLQVEGVADVIRVGLAVDASMSVYHKAADLGCQFLLVHHGIIWGGIKAITGPVYNHLKFLIEHGINLYAAHLPLDLHPEAGNNICLVRLLKLSDVEPFGAYKGIDIGFAGVLPKAATIEQVSGRLKDHLGGTVRCLPFGPELNTKLGIVSGSGSDCIPEAISRGMDCVITGEPKHENHHTALEGAINVVYCGHYESEQLGVKEVGKILAEHFGVVIKFIDEPTLV